MPSPALRASEEVKAEVVEIHAEAADPATGKETVMTFEVESDDVAALIWLSGLAGGRSNLDNVVVEASAGELRMVATDARVLGVLRFFGDGADVPERGKDALTPWRPTVTGVVASGVVRERLSAFAKGRGSKKVIVFVTDEKLFFEAGGDRVELALESRGAMNYIRIFESTTPAKGQPVEEVILDADQWTRIIKAAGGGTVGLRKKLRLVTSQKVVDGGPPVPVVVEVVDEKILWGPRRRWVGLVAAHVR